MSLLWLPNPGAQQTVRKPQSYSPGAFSSWALPMSMSASNELCGLLPTLAVTVLQLRLSPRLLREKRIFTPRSNPSCRKRGGGGTQHEQLLLILDQAAHASVDYDPEIDTADKISKKRREGRPAKASHTVRRGVKRVRHTREKHAKSRGGYQTRRVALPDETPAREWRSRPGRPTIHETRGRDGERGWRRSKSDPYFGPREGPKRPPKG